MKLPFRKKKKKEEPAPTLEEPDLGERVLPSELEKFKLKGPFEQAVSEKPPEKGLGRPLTPPRFGPGAPEKPEARPAAGADKLELIISKLDIIEARLRVIEEKLKRF